MADRWANQVDMQEVDGNYLGIHQANNTWNETLDVARGQSQQRLNMNHGFLQSIIKNQKERDAYEQSQQQALEKSSGQEKQCWRSKEAKTGDDPSQSKPRSSFVGNEENSSENCRVPKGAAGSWKEAQLQQAMLLKQEEEKLAAQTQKSRTGRGNFTYTDGHPKDRKGHKEPAGKGSGRKAWRDDPEGKESAGTLPDRPQRTRKEVKVRAGFGAYVPCKPNTSALDTMEGTSSAEAGTAQTNGSEAAVEAQQQNKSQRAKTKRDGAGAEQLKSRSEAAETKGTDRKTSSSADGAPRHQRKEPRMRPGHGAYVAPTRREESAPAGGTDVQAAPPGEAVPTKSTDKTGNKRQRKAKQEQEPLATSGTAAAPEMTDGPRVSEEVNLEPPPGFEPPVGTQARKVDELTSTPVLHRSPAKATSETQAKAGLPKPPLAPVQEAIQPAVKACAEPLPASIIQMDEGTGVEGSVDNADKPPSLDEELKDVDVVKRCKTWGSLLSTSDTGSTCPPLKAVETKAVHHRASSWAPASPLAAASRNCRVKAFLQAREVSTGSNLDQGRVVALAARQIEVIDALLHLEERLSRQQLGHEL